MHEQDEEEKMVSWKLLGSLLEPKETPTLNSDQQRWGATPQQVK